MLDDCSGERFEELLCAFSTLVLQKTIQERRVSRQSGVPVAERLAVANRMDEHDIQTSQGLLWAYRSSLHTSLVQREETKTRLLKLESELQNTMTSLEARCSTAEALLAANEPRLVASSVDPSVMLTELRTVALSTDDYGWFEIITTGDSAPTHSDLLGADFIDLWNSHVIHNEPHIYVARPKSALEDLQSRITAQQNRVKRLRAFHSEVSSRNEEAVISLQTPGKKSPAKSPMKSPRKGQLPDRPYSTPRTPKVFGQHKRVARLPDTPKLVPPRQVLNGPP